MKPGRELDALVAEKVMKVPLIAIKKGLFDKQIIIPNPIGTIIRYRVANYSTEIKDAWQIVDKIPMTISAPTAPYASGEYANSSDTEWDVECTRINPKPMDWSDTVTARSDSAPHAICLAALKAVGIDVT